MQALHQGPQNTTSQRKEKENEKTEIAKSHVTQYIYIYIYIRNHLRQCTAFFLAALLALGGPTAAFAQSVSEQVPTDSAFTQTQTEVPVEAQGDDPTGSTDTALVVPDNYGSELGQNQNSDESNPEMSASDDNAPTQQAGDARSDTPATPTDDAIIPVDEPVAKDPAPTEEPTANDGIALLAADADIDGSAPAGTTNLAPGATITLSECTANKKGNPNSYEMPSEGWCKAFLTDGALDKGWSTDPYDSESNAEAPVTLTFDLGTLKTVHQVSLFAKTKALFPTDYNVQISEDGENWTVVATATGVDKEPTGPQHHSFIPAYARYVRIHVTRRFGEDSAGGGAGNDGKLVQLAEVAIYGNDDKVAVTGDRTSIDSYKPSGYENVAMGKTVTASSTYNPSDATWGEAFLVDGHLGTPPSDPRGWTTMPGETTDPNKVAWATVDLGAEYAARRIVLFPRSDTANYGESFPVNFQVQISNDNQSWTDVQAFTGLPQPDAPVVVDCPELVTGRYVRLYVTGRVGADSTSGGGGVNDGKLVQLAELAVFGRIASTTVTPNKTALELLPGQSDNIVLDVLTESNTPLTFVWRSDDAAVATVDNSGKITGVAKGNTKVHAIHEALGLDITVDVLVVDKKFSFDDNILIAIFWPPTSEYMDAVEDDSRWEEQYKLLADADIDFINNVTGNDLNSKEHNLKMAAYAYQYGMRVSVADNRFGNALQTQTADEIKALIAEYRNVPGVAGYYILDEPLNPNLYNDIYAAIKQADPTGYAHLNFLPYGVYGEEVCEKQMHDWLTLNASTGYPQDYLMYDLYPYPDNSTEMNRTGFLTNMRIAWKVGLAHGVKTGNYLQSMRIPGAYRCPSVAEIRYEAMMGLAFGYKQLSYFTWFTPSNRSEPFDEGIILLDGSTNPKTYDGVVQLNKEIHALGTTLIHLDAKEIYLNGETWGQPAIPAAFFAQPQDTTNYTVSYLRDKTTGRNYMMVVNNNYSEAATMTLKLDGAITGLQRVSAADGSLSAVALGDGNTLQLTLAAGDGALFALPEGYDCETVTTPEANDNLALNTTVNVNNSVGGEGWYVSNLTDGIRTSDASKNSNGWKSNTASATLTLDLGAVRTFNRVDLYPVGDLFAYGVGMPTDFAIEVSADGSTWKTVYDTSDETAAPTDTYQPRSVPFDAVEARYIRIDVRASNDSYVALAEVEVYNDDGTVPAPVDPSINDEVVDYHEGDNLLLERPYAVSSSTPDSQYAQWGWSAKYLNDGIAKSGNGWTSNVKINPDQATAREWCGFYLGDTFAVNKVRIYCIDKACFPIDYRIQLSMDGHTWTDVHTVTDDSDAGGWREFDLTATQAKYLRIYGDKLRQGGNDGYLMQIGEVEAYGSPVTDTTAAEEALTATQAKTEELGTALDGEDTAALEKAIADLRTAVHDPDATQTKLNALTAAVEQALTDLLTVDTTAAESALQAAKDALPTLTVDTQQLKTATEALQAALPQVGKTIFQARLDTLTTTLQTAYDTATQAQAALDQAKDDLQKAIQAAKALDMGNYEQANQAEFSAALAAAQEALQGSTDTAALTAALQRLTAAQAALKKVSIPIIIEGNGAVYDGKTALSFRSDDRFENFIKVILDGQDLDPKYYHVASGSIVVVISTQYLQTLPAGRHEIGIVSKNGTALASFTIPAAAASGTSSGTGATSPNTIGKASAPATPKVASKAAAPQTASADVPVPTATHSNNSIAWGGLLILAVVALAAVVWVTKKRGWAVHTVGEDATTEDR